MIETPTAEATDRAASAAADEAQSFLAELSQLVRFYKEGLLSEQEFQTAKQKLLQESDSPWPMDSAWY